MMLLCFTVLVALAAQVKGENLVSCANTPCTGTKVCKIIQRCWGKDCQVGTTCMEPQDVPAGSGGTCQYDTPLLQSQNGGVITEIQCGAGAINSECPTGSMCVDPPGICCTGATKNTGACPSKPSHYFLSRGSCKVFCRHDQDCSGFQVCCDTGVGCNACMDSVPVSTCETKSCPMGFHCVMAESECIEYPCFARPTCTEDKVGQCPVLPRQTSCANQCMVDSHCPGMEKCCSSGGCNVCVQPGFSSSSITSPSPPLNINGGFEGLGGSSGGPNNLDPTTTIAPSGFSDMSGFLDSSRSSSSIGSTGSSIGSTSLSGTPSDSLGSSNGISSGSSGSASLASSSSLSANGGTTSFSDMLNAMQSMQKASGTTTSTGTNSISSMMDALKTLQNTGGTSSLSTMLNNYQNLMGSSSGGMSMPAAMTPNSISGSSSNSFNMLSDPTGGSSSLNSLGSLSPSLSGSTLQTLGSGGGLDSFGLGGGLMPQGAGLNPQLPTIGGRRMTQPVQHRNSFQCGPMCMMLMMMGS